MAEQPEDAGKGQNAPKHKTERLLGHRLPPSLILLGTSALRHGGWSRVGNRSNKESLTPVECAHAHIRCMRLSTDTLSGPQISADTQLEGRSIDLDRLWPCSRRSLFEATSETSAPDHSMRGLGISGIAQVRPPGFVSRQQRGRTHGSSPSCGVSSV